jgi:hypothetical protein
MLSCLTLIKIYFTNTLFCSSLIFKSSSLRIVFEAGMKFSLQQGKRQLTHAKKFNWRNSRVICFFLILKIKNDRLRRSLPNFRHTAFFRVKFYRNSVSSESASLKILNFRKSFNFIITNLILRSVTWFLT